MYFAAIVVAWCKTTTSASKVHVTKERGRASGAHNAIPGLIKGDINTMLELNALLDARTITGAWLECFCSN